MISVTKLLFMDEYYGDALRYGHNAHRMKSGAAEGMGPVVVWNSTRTCNLRCRHCYMSSDGQKYDGELTTEEAKRFIDDLAEFRVPVLLFSGGEPLIRPDFFELPMPETGERKWVMLVNINPGCPFGGSATEYFIGTFDGETFTPDTKPEVARWLDFGKDHYAFVTFHGVKERILGMPWTSNWQYANVTPFKQSRGMNGLPRELFLFSSAGRSYVGSRPAREVTTLRREQILQPDLMLRDSVLFSNLMKDYAGDFELELEFTPDPAVERVGFTLLNEEGDSLPVYFDMKQGRVVMDRTRSGITDFGEKATPHERESGDWRQREGLNYHNDFALSTWAPLELCVRRSYRLRLFIDRSLAELFVEDGRIAMTNLIFPNSPYTSLRLFSEGGKTKVTHFRLYHLSL